MGGVCAGRFPAAAPYGSLDLSSVDLGSCGESRRQMRTGWVTGVEGTWLPQVHLVCPHNEVAALCLRVLAPLPSRVFEPLGADVLAVFGQLRRLAGSFRRRKWSLQETAESYKGLLRRRYVEAARSLEGDSPVSPGDARLSCFLKAEKLNVGPKFPKPRAIFPRSPRYNLALASRLKPFEHWLWGRLTSKGLGCRGVGRLVAKGLSPRQRANLIVRKFKNLRECVVFEVDGKAWEAHTGPAQLKAEHGVYEAAFPGDRELSWLLREQMVLRGRMPCGAKFSRPGGRASGDFNTGMGNSVTMLAVVIAALRRFGCRYDVLVDGDNALVFLQACDLQGVLGGFAQYVLDSSGHELTLESPCRVIERIRFGQSSPVWTGPRGWSMVRDWRKVLSGATSSHRWLREPSFAREYLAGVARCELSLALGLPVLQAWCLELLRALDFRGDVRAHPHVDYFVVGAWLAGEQDARPVLPECRESFERAFGLSPEQQVRIEGGLSAPRELGFVEVPPFVDCDSSAPGVMESWLDSRV